MNLIYEKGRRDAQLALIAKALLQKRFKDLMLYKKIEVV
jgi:hypothetical protein